MKLPGVTPGQMKRTRLYAEYTKVRLAARNGNLNIPVVLPALFHKARRSLRV